MRRCKLSLRMVGLVGFLLQSGCMSYMQIEPAEAMEYEEIRITTTSEHTESIWEPHLRADTLVGRRASGDTLRIPVARVQKIEAGRTDALKTVGLFVGGAALVLVVVGAIWAATDPCLGLSC